MAVASPPNTTYPIGTRVGFLDPWGRNPIEGVVARHYGETDILIEDARGVVYFGATWRVESVLGSAPAKLSAIDLSDLL